MTVAILYRIVKNQKEKGVKEPEKMGQYSTNLIIETLNELYCKPGIEDDKILFEYQGELFYIDLCSQFVSIWNKSYCHNCDSEYDRYSNNVIDTYLQEAICKFQKATYANYGIPHGRPWTICDWKDKRIDVFCELELYNIHELSDSKIYFQSILPRIFTLRNELKRQFHNLLKPNKLTNSQRIEIEKFIN